MREIKFRAWDKQNEVWIDDFKFTHYSDGTLGVSDSTPPFNKYGPTLLQQYTGLTDTNGTEIYEGDILRCDDNGENFGGHWNDDTDEWEPDNAYEIYWADMCYWLRDKNGSLDMEYSPFIDTEFEVIGNIHENPELMK